MERLGCLNFNIITQHTSRYILQHIVITVENDHINYYFQIGFEYNNYILRKQRYYYSILEKHETHHTKAFTELLHNTWI